MAIRTSILVPISSPRKKTRRSRLYGRPVSDRWGNDNRLPQSRGLSPNAGVSLFRDVRPPPFPEGEAFASPNTFNHPIHKCKFCMDTMFPTSKFMEEAANKMTQLPTSVFSAVKRYLCDMFESIMSSVVVERMKQHLAGEIAAKAIPLATCQTVVMTTQLITILMSQDRVITSLAAVGFISSVLAVLYAWKVMDAKENSRATKLLGQLSQSVLEDTLSVDTQEPTTDTTNSQNAEMVTSALSDALTNFQVSGLSKDTLRTALGDVSNGKGLRFAKFSVFLTLYLSTIFGKDSFLKRVTSITSATLAATHISSFVDELASDLFGIDLDGKRAVKAKYAEHLQRGHNLLVKIRGTASASIVTECVRWMELNTKIIQTAGRQINTADAITLVQQLSAYVADASAHLKQSHKQVEPVGLYIWGAPAVGKTYFVQRVLFPELAKIFSCSPAYYDYGGAGSRHAFTYLDQQFCFWDEWSNWDPNVAGTAERNLGLLKLLGPDGFTVSAAAVNEKQQATKFLSFVATGNAPMTAGSACLSGLTSEGKAALFTRLSCFEARWWRPIASRYDEDRSHLEGKMTLHTPTPIKFGWAGRNYAFAPDEGLKPSEFIKYVASMIRRNAVKFTAEMKTPIPMDVETEDLGFSLTDLFPVPESMLQIALDTLPDDAQVPTSDEIFYDAAEDHHDDFHDAVQVQGDEPGAPAPMPAVLPQKQTYWIHGPANQGKTTMTRKAVSKLAALTKLRVINVRNLSPRDELERAIYVADDLVQLSVEGQQTWLEFWNSLPLHSHVVCVSNYDPRVLTWTETLLQWRGFRHVPGFPRRSFTDGAARIPVSDLEDGRTILSVASHYETAASTLRVRETEGPIVPPFTREESDLWLELTKEPTMADVLSLPAEAVFMKSPFTLTNTVQAFKPCFEGRTKASLLSAADNISKIKPTARVYARIGNFSALIHNGELTLSRDNERLLQLRPEGWMLCLGVLESPVQRADVLRAVAPWGTVGLTTSQIAIADGLGSLLDTETQMVTDFLANYMEPGEVVVAVSELTSRRTPVYKKKWNAVWWLQFIGAVGTTVWLVERSIAGIRAVSKWKSESKTRQEPTESYRRVPRPREYGDDSCTGINHRYPRGRQTGTRIETVPYEDKDNLSAFKNKVLGNIIRLENANGDVTSSFIGYMIDSLMGITVAHGVGPEGSRCDAYEDREGVTTKIPMRVIYRVEDRDLAFIRPIDHDQTRHFKNLRNSFVSKDVKHVGHLSIMRTFYMCAGDWQTKEVSARFFADAHCYSSWNVKKHAMYVNFDNQYDRMPRGSSGTPYWALQGRSQQPFICGVQSSTSYVDRSSVAALVYLEDIHDAYKHLLDTQEVTTRGDGPRPIDKTSWQSAEILEESVTGDTNTPLTRTPFHDGLYGTLQEKPALLAPHPPFHVVATTKRPLHTETRGTKVGHRPGFEILSRMGYEDVAEPAWPFKKTERDLPEKIPPDMNGNRHAAYMRMEKARSHRKFEHHEQLELNQRARDMADHYWRQCDQPANLDFLTLEEAVGGTERLGITGVDAGTSAGPSIQMRWPRIQQKRQLLVQNPENNRWRFNDTPEAKEVHEQALQTWDMLKEGHRPLYLGTMKRKDEVLPKDKAHRSRVFTARDFVEVLNEKRVLAPVQALFQRNVHHLAPQLGVDWDLHATPFMRGHLAHGSKTFLGDFSGYDWTVSPGHMEAMGHFFLHFYDLCGASEKQQNIIRTTFEALKVQYSVVGEQVWQIHGTMSSGMYGTSLIDSVLSDFLIVCAAMDVTGYEQDNVRQLLHISTCGDDVVATIEEGREDELPLPAFIDAVRDHGFDLTTATKDADFCWTPVKELQFVSKTFPLLPGGVIHGPKRIETSLSKEMFWTKGQDMDEIRQGNHRLLLQAALHGKEEYDKWGKFCREWDETYQRNPDQPVYRHESHEAFLCQFTRDVLSTACAKPKITDEISEETPIQVKEKIVTKEITEIYDQIISMEIKWNSKTRNKVLSALSASDSEAPCVRWLRSLPSDEPILQTTQTIRLHGTSLKVCCPTISGPYWPWATLQTQSQQWPKVLGLLEKLVGQLEQHSISTWTESILGLLLAATCAGRSRTVALTQRAIPHMRTLQPWTNSRPTTLIEWTQLDSIISSWTNLQMYQQTEVNNQRQLLEPSGPTMHGPSLHPDQQSWKSTMARPTTMGLATPTSAELMDQQQLPEPCHLNPLLEQTGAPDWIEHPFKFPTAQEIAQTIDRLEAKTPPPPPLPVPGRLEQQQHATSCGNNPWCPSTTPTPAPVLSTTPMDPQSASNARQKNHTAGTNNTSSLKRSSPPGQSRRGRSRRGAGPKKSRVSDSQQPTMMKTTVGAPAPTPGEFAAAPTTTDVQARLPFAQSSDATPVPVLMSGDWGLQTEGLVTGGYGQDAKDLAYKAQRVSSSTISSNMSAGTLIERTAINPWNVQFVGENISFWADAHQAFSGSFVVTYYAQAAPQIYGSLIVAYLPFVAGNPENGELDIPFLKKYPHVILDLKSGGEGSFIVRPTTDRLNFIYRSENLPYMGELVVMTNAQVANVIGPDVQIPFLRDVRLNDDGMYLTPSHVSSKAGSTLPPQTPFPPLLAEPGLYVIDGGRPDAYIQQERTGDLWAERERCLTAEPTAESELSWTIPWAQDHKSVWYNTVDPSTTTRDYKVGRLCGHFTPGGTSPSDYWDKGFPLSEKVPSLTEDDVILWEGAENAVTTDEYPGLVAIWDTPSGGPPSHEPLPDTTIPTKTNRLFIKQEGARLSDEYKAQWTMMWWSERLIPIWYKIGDPVIVKPSDNIAGKTTASSLMTCVKTDTSQPTNAAGLARLLIVPRESYVPTLTPGASLQNGVTMPAPKRTSDYWLRCARALPDSNSSAIITLSLPTGEYAMDVLVNMDGIWVDAGVERYAIAQEIDVTRLRETVNMHSQPYPAMRPISPTALTWLSRTTGNVSICGLGSVTRACMIGTTRRAPVTKLGEMRKRVSDTQQPTAAAAMAAAGMAGGSLLDAITGITGTIMGNRTSRSNAKLYAKTALQLQDKKYEQERRNATHARGLDYMTMNNAK